MLLLINRRWDKKVSQKEFLSNLFHDAIIY